MQTVLFHSTIFGPIHSRRLGTSLGVNLMPDDGKVCSFDCLYCEAGFNAQGKGTTGLPSRDAVRERLEGKLRQMSENNEQLDVITFSGNGEPTLHPEFAGVIDDTIALRDKYFPNVKISVLSNSTKLSDPKVCEALRKVDNNILKLDSAIENTMRAIDRPASALFTVDSVVDQLTEFGGQCIIQTMMVSGEYEGKHFDNTTPEEIDALVEAYKRIQPKSVMLYSIDRTTPAKSLQKIGHGTLDKIADEIRSRTGIEVTVA